MKKSELFFLFVLHQEFFCEKRFLQCFYLLKKIHKQFFLPEFFSSQFPGEKTGLEKKKKNLNIFPENVFVILRRIKKGENCFGVKPSETKFIEIKSKNKLFNQ